MPNIKFISHNGNNCEVYAENGTSLMETAVYHSIAGVVADCGGACSCATCHVYVDPAWVAATGSPQHLEQDMLECAMDLQDNSRLSCQIEVSDELDGLVVRMPELQI